MQQVSGRERDPTQTVASAMLLFDRPVGAVNRDPIGAGIRNLSNSPNLSNLQFQCFKLIGVGFRAFLGVENLFHLVIINLSISAFEKPSPP